MIVLGSQVVELEVRLLVAVFPEPGKVGLVPHLEVPTGNFGLSVALFKVPDKGVNQVAPAVWLRMRCVPMPIEDAVLRCRQRFWSKAELDKWLDMSR